VREFLGCAALGADDAHADGRRDVRDLLADGAEAEDAECLAGERRGDAADPLAVLLVLHDGGVGLGEVEQRAEDVSAIDSRWVPRAQVRVRLGGRSGSASQVSTPAVSASAQRSFAMRGRRQGGAPQASIASVSARCAWVGCPSGGGPRL